MAGVRGDREGGKKKEGWRDESEGRLPDSSSQRFCDFEQHSDVLSLSPYPPS